MAGADGATDQNTSPSTAPNHGSPVPSAPAPPKPEPKTTAAMTVEYDDFGLPIRKYRVAEVEETPESKATAGTAGEPDQATKGDSGGDKDSTEKPEDEKQAAGAASSSRIAYDTENGAGSGSDRNSKDAASPARIPSPDPSSADAEKSNSVPHKEGKPSDAEFDDAKPEIKPAARAVGAEETPAKIEDLAVSEARKTEPATEKHDKRTSRASLSEFSHQQLTSEQTEKKGDPDAGWQVMPAFAPYDIYDDDNKLIAKEYNEAEEDETYGYAGLGGAGKGYTKVLLDDDAESATSMDENTQYLFKDPGGGTSTSMMDDDETQRDAVSQLQATKELLTEGQRIAYVGLTRLELSAMLKEAEALESSSHRTKKHLRLTAENMKMWSQKMMIRLYSHMDISPDEQVMIEQLSAHGVMPQDLTPVLMQNARVKNPMADKDDARSSVSSPSPSLSRPASIASPITEQAAEPPPPYSVDDDTELTAPVRTPSQMPTTQKIDIDIRWTVLCDLFLVLIADSIYDARSRMLLEKVAKDLEITWLDICRFEKKVTDALEMQANAENENWNEDEHMENRRKMALKRRYMMMGLATVGGGLVIGLSAGLLAPVIGLGLAAGFTTIGITGTGGFLAGAGGAAIITSTAAASGSVIGVRAANRRTGAVKTFEYRPLHNNKRVNLIVTVSGWMTGKVDDVRLPFSTVDPVMGDIYSVLWEPDMLTSMGATINILATEALTQGLQQILGNTILVGLMAALTLPVVLTKLSYLIDNPWTVSLDRANMAGLILADSLIDRNLGTRPVTLVGYSLGSRVIFSCLLELAKKGAFGLVQNVYMFGSPVVVKKDEWLRARTVVAGRFINGYNRNDWILGYLFRLTSGGIRRVAGLAPIEDIPGIENMDAAEFVVGHMDYRTAMPRLLRECGWMVESDEFTEIEDPDPDNYQERQRELISEIEEARRELEKEGAKAAAAGKGGGGGFGFFKRKKAPQKQEWEVYEDSTKGATAAAKVGSSCKTEDKEGNNHGVLFDVDAIRAEIALESSKHKMDGDPLVDEELLQVREIKSTLPPIKVSTASNAASPSAQRHSLRETKSAEAVPVQSAGKAPSSSSANSPSRGQTPSRDRTTPEPKPTSSPYYHSYGYTPPPSYGHDELDHDGEIQMTFDTGFGNDDRKPLSSTSAGGDPAAARPEIKTAQTVPNIKLTDPWADYGDDDDEEFGKEKEIEMTFA
ncbi:hypothetical protein N0V88_004422 [Collariella sp. IMI 366227]|nr:hypothetical protein N0V88_004422 [Collariella sp. IMI 366227]